MIAGKRIMTVLAVLLLVELLSAEETTVVYGNPEKIFSAPVRLKKPYGVCAHLSRPPVDSDDGKKWSLREQEMRLMVEAGISIFRTDFDWSRILPEEDAPLHFTHLDVLLDCMDQYQLSILPILGGIVPKAMRPPWRFEEAWRQQVNALAERYKGRIPVYEIWNEMDYSKFWYDTPSAEKYTRMLQIASESIRERDPQAKILLGGLANLSLEFLEKVYRAGGGVYFDIVNFHQYHHNRVPEAWIPGFRKLRRLMEKYNSTDKRLWITETGCNTAQADYEEQLGIGFFTEVLPLLCRKLGMEPNKISIGLLSDQAKAFVGAGLLDAQSCFGSFAERIPVTLDAFRTLDPKQVPVLVVSTGEEFPVEYFDALERYVRYGGTVVFSYGVPLFSDIMVSGKQIGEVSTNWRRTELEKRLHIHSILPWSPAGREQGVPEKSVWQKPADGFDFRYRWNVGGWQGARYVDARNLKEGDEFIPVLVSGNDRYSGAEIALYRLNSDLKGNVIVQTRKVFSMSVTPERQAERVPRIYLLSLAFGVEKVFWYNLRSLERDASNSEWHYGLVHKDLTPKPAFIAYRTLTRMCPDQSTRPAIEERQGVFIARWIKPDGTKISAVWTAVSPVKLRPKIKGNPKFYNLYGEELAVNPEEFFATPAVTYIVRAEGVEL